MKHRPWRIILVLLFATILLFGQVHTDKPAMAAFQTEGRLEVYAPDTSQFPLVKFKFKLFDAANSFIADLQQEQVKVLEDGSVLELQNLTRQEPGVQIILAYNPSTAFASQAPGGNYFTFVQQSLQIWAQNQPADTPNVFSITTSTGLQAVQLTNPADWLQAISTFQPELYSAEANLISLSVALDLAIDPSAKPGMGSVIFYVTSLLPNNLVEALPNQLSRAKQAGVPVFVWLIAPGGLANTPAAEPFIQLAGETGGQFYVVSTNEELPSLDSYLQPLRFSYEATYTSQVVDSGSHSLQVEVNRSGQVLTSSVTNYSIDVQPPTPIFLTPPISIERTWTANDNGDKELLPKTINIQYMVEFPDGHTRDLEKAVLYMDGEVVAQNASPPFSGFILPLEAVEESKTIQLQIEVVDELGLSQRSIQIPVQVMVEQTGIGQWLKPANLVKLGIGAAGLLVIAGIVFIVLRLRKNGRVVKHEGRKFAPNKHRKAPLDRMAAQKIGSKPTRQLVRKPAITHERQIPEKQPLRRVTPDAVNAPKTPTPENVMPARKPIHPASSAPARLVWVGEDGKVLANSPLSLVLEDVTIGNDPSLVTQYIDAPSLSAIHARLKCSQQGEWHLYDNNSIAGTYVNYNPIDKKGVSLQHGDLIQLGTVSFRFELANPTKIPRPIITSG